MCERAFGARFRLAIKSRGISQNERRIDFRKYFHFEDFAQRSETWKSFLFHFFIRRRGIEKDSMFGFLRKPP